jgi:uncharacterized protein YjiS (DUF1127 family)
MIMSTAVFDIFRDRQNFGTALKAPSHILKVAHLAWQVRRERNRLASFSREELAELDINPGDAQLEATRGLFDLPKSRLEVL